jgi:hypothetical protein
MSAFTEKMVEDTARQRLVREIEPTYSEWPAGSSHWASGYIATPATDGAFILLSVPSSRWFKPRHLWIWNDTGVINAAVFYFLGSAASCSLTIGKIWMQPRSTEFIAWDCETWPRDVFVSNLVTQMGMRVAGILLNSAPE